MDAIVQALLLEVLNGMLRHVGQPQHRAPVDPHPLHPRCEFTGFEPIAQMHHVAEQSPQPACPAFEYIQISMGERGPFKAVWKEQKHTQRRDRGQAEGAAPRPRIRLGWPPNSGKRV